MAIKILIVDDDPDIRDVLKLTLSEENYEIFEARDGEEALSIIKGQKVPDLVLLDLILPKLSGFEIMEKINTDPALASVKIPIVVITNLGQESDVQKGQQLGAIGYFVKAQLSIESLVSHVKEFFT